MEANVTTTYIHTAHLPMKEYPLIRLFPVAAVYLGANSKNGYFKRLAIKITQISSKPKLAPALVL
jgi:hypothetical protein